MLFFREEVIATADQADAGLGQVKKIKEIILAVLEQNKAENIVSIPLKDKSTIADYMVIATGRSSRQVLALAQKIKEEASKHGILAHLEGTDTGNWVVVDTGDILVHLFRPEVREFYELEKLWGTDFSGMEFSTYQSA